MTVPAKQIVPTNPVAYVIMHQAPGGQPQDDYLHSIRDLHRKVAGEESHLREAFEKLHTETIPREAQVLYGALSAFLVTPLKSDQAEVRALIAETLTRVAHAGSGDSFPGLLGMILSRIVPLHASDPEMIELRNAGSEYLSHLKFSENAGDVYESAFLVDGSAGLDVLEHIVRDRLGIYAGAHGKHLAQTSGWMFAAYNVVFAETLSASAQSFDARFWLNKPPAMHYDNFRLAIEEVLNDLKGVAGVAGLGLWQRKLGFGAGREFICRIACSDMAATESAIRIWAAGYRRVFPRDISPDRPSLLLSEFFAVE
ncbi:MAG: hypothetical protein WB699_17230 [Bacteroidota bacterium]